MADKFLCVMVGYDEATEAHLSSLQQRLYDAGFVGTHTKNIPQHATLGMADCKDEAQMIELVRRVAESTQPFDVTFNHIGIFGGGKVLFIAPDASHALLNLKECFGSSDNWTAHTTMLIDEPDAIRGALPVLQQEFSAFRGQFTHLHLYEFWPTRQILSVKLGGDKPC